MLILQSLAVVAILTLGVGWLFGAWTFYKALCVGGTPARDYEKRDDTGLRGVVVSLRLEVLVAIWPIVIALSERNRNRAAAWGAVDPWDGRWPGKPKCTHS